MASCPLSLERSSSMSDVIVAISAFDSVSLVPRYWTAVSVVVPFVPSVFVAKEASYQPNEALKADVLSMRIMKDALLMSVP